MLSFVHSYASRGASYRELMQMFGVERRLAGDPSDHCSLLYILGLQASHEGAGRRTQRAKYRVDARHFLAKLPEIFARKGGSLTEKREKFRVLAERRTNAAMEAILRIGKLSNRQAYEFDEQDVKKIVRALHASVTEIEERFAVPRRRTESKFSL